MGATLEHLRKSPALRWGRVVFGVLMMLLALVGIAGLGDDLDTWGNWLGGIESGFVYGLLYGVLLVVGVALWAIEGYRPPARRDVEVPIRAVKPTDAPAPAAVVVDPPAPAIDHPATPLAAPVRPDAGESSRDNAPKLSDRLQAQLDKGIALRRDVPGIAGVRVISLVRPETTEADVTMWIKRTRRMLYEQPELLAEFNYRPAKAILSSFMEGRTILDPPRFKKDLDQRIANLKGIIADLRYEGR